MAEEEKKKEEAPAKAVVHTYPLVRHSDMPEETRSEAVELVATACEKFFGNNEGAARMVKEEMDKKFGAPHHVVIGESYGFEVSYECGNILYMFFGGNVAAGAAKMIKDELDKKFGPPHQVVVGEAYGFEVSYECGNILYMFVGGNLAVVIWKC